MVFNSTVVPVFMLQITKISGPSIIIRCGRDIEKKKIQSKRKRYRKGEIQSKRTRCREGKIQRQR